MTACPSCGRRDSGFDDVNKLEGGFNRLVLPCGYDFFGDDRTLDTHIKLLRKSLGKYADYIVTLRGVGYRFEDHK